MEQRKACVNFKKNTLILKKTKNWGFLDYFFRLSIEKLVYAPLIVLYAISFSLFFSNFTKLLIIKFMRVFLFSLSNFSFPPSIIRCNKIKILVYVISFFPEVPIHLILDSIFSPLKSFSKSPFELSSIFILLSSTNLSISLESNLFLVILLFTFFSSLAALLAAVLIALLIIF